MFVCLLLLSLSLSSLLVVVGGGGGGGGSSSSSSNILCLHYVCENHLHYILIKCRTLVKFCFNLSCKLRLQGIKNKVHIMQNKCLHLY